MDILVNGDVGPTYRDNSKRELLFRTFSIYIITFSDMTTIQIETENTQMTNDLYRLLKKYTGLRNLIRALKVM